jgi:hypothetical protein
MVGNMIWLYIVTNGPYRRLAYFIDILSLYLHKDVPIVLWLQAKVGLIEQ